MVSRLDDLRSMKSLVEESILAVPAVNRAPLVNQWRALSAEIAVLEADEEPIAKGSVLDELKKRRDARGARTTG